MRITEIETFAVSAGWKNWLFVKVHTDAGIHGIGEGTLNGFIRTTEAGVQELKHLAIGQDPLRIQSLAKRMLDSVSLDGGHIHRTVIAAVEVACWDILGKHLGVPVHQLLGGRVRDSVLGYANGWYRTERSPEAFLDAAQAVTAKGFKAFKVDPFGTAQGFIDREELELAYAICRTLRDGLPSDTRILIDVHARFTEIAAIRAAERFADLDIFWWEEPTSRDRQETVHEVAHRSPIPVATGEMYDTVGQFYSLAAGGRREHLPTRTHVPGRHRPDDAGRRPGRGAWQCDRPSSERRPRRDGGLPAACRLRSELPHPGALRRLQRTVDPGSRDLAPGDRPGERAPVPAGRARARHRPQPRRRS
jgi:galactonate dehydratase